MTTTTIPTTESKAKLLRVSREGDLFTMTIQNNSGQKEKWHYERDETASGVSYNQVGREDTR